MREAPADHDAVDAELRRRLGKVAHDLNGPLSAMQMQLYLHRKALAGPTPPDAHGLEVMERNVERMRQLVAAMAAPQGPDPVQPGR